MKAIQRLFIYLNHKEIPHTRFEKDAGLSNGYLKQQLKREADLGEGMDKKSYRLLSGHKPNMASDWSRRNDKFKYRNSKNRN